MDSRINWPDCDLIEKLPGKMGGQPVIKGTRLRPDDLLNNRDQGIDWIVANHGGISPDTVARIFAFYDRHKSAHAPAFG